MIKTHIIQKLIEKYGYTIYLEIGIRGGQNFQAIKLKDKTGVDPATNKHVTHKMTSDTFFSENKRVYDLIFIDGLHEYEQVYRDITNALKVLQPNGTIVCHDMLPTTEISQQYPRATPCWNGNCWKAWVRLRQERKDLNMRVVDIDWGCGIIQFGEQKVLAPIAEEDMTFANYMENRQLWMNVITEEDVIKELT